MGTFFSLFGSKDLALTFWVICSESWVNNFPSDWKFISTLDLANQSLEIAVEEAVASVKYAGADKIAWFELGNEVRVASQSWSCRVEGLTQTPMLIL